MKDRFKKLFFGIVWFFACTFLLNAGGVNDFIGKWKVVVEGTPSGDATMVFLLTKDGDSLKGTVQQEGEDTVINLDRIEVGDKEITIYWNTNNYDVYLWAEKIDENEIEGSLMDMFDAYGERVED